MCHNLKLKNMKNLFIIKKALICTTLLMSCYSLNGFSQETTPETTRIQLQLSIDYNKSGSHDWRRTPPATRVVLPSVFYDSNDKTITLSSEMKHEGVNVEILDGEGNVWLQECVTIETGKSAIIDIETLPSDVYNIRIWIGGKAYIATFTLEE